MLTAVSASDDIVQEDNILNSDISPADVSDVLGDQYYDDDFYITVQENYTWDKKDWNSRDLIYISSYSQKNGTFSFLVDGDEKLNVPLTNGYFSIEDDGMGGKYNKTYEYIYPGNLSLDTGNYNIKVKFERNTLIDSQVTLKEKDDFDFYIVNPYCCDDEDYFDYPSFITIDSNHNRTGTLEIFVNGTRKTYFNVNNGAFDEIPDCSNKSRYLAPSDILDDYGTYDIKITFTDSSSTETLRDEIVQVIGPEPSEPKLEMSFYFGVQYLRADNMAYIYLPREATGKLTIRYNDHVFDVPYSDGYGEHKIYAWNVQYLGETLVTAIYEGDDFATLTANGTIIVTPGVTIPYYASLGEEFTVSMITHEWVYGGKFDVYDYTGDVKGDLISSGVINGGVSSVTVSSDTLGLNKFYLEYDTLGSGKYYSIHEVNIIENSENVEVDVPGDVLVGDDFNLTVTAPARNFSFVSISIDGSTPELCSIDSGKLIKTVSGLSECVHKITVQYDIMYYEDGEWLEDVYSNTFTVNAWPYCTIDAPDITKFYKGPEKLVAIVKDKNDNPIYNATVNFIINGQNYARHTDGSGIASMAINLESGVYDATAKSAMASANSTITVKATISGNDVTKMYRNDTQYYATFIDTRGNLLKNTGVEFNINGVFYTRTTNDKGIAKMNINLNPGTYKITAKNPNSTELHTNVITVLSSIVENNDLTKYYRNGSQFTFRLLDSQGNPVGAGVNAKININGVFYTRTTNASGHVKLNINLNPDTYIATIEYNGLMMSNAVKVLPILKANDLSMRYKDGSKFEATLLDGQGKSYANQVITFNINGVFYDRSTDENGIARLNINLMPGEYIITSMYENGAAISNKITIKN